jgi:hypothetical protein
MHTVGAGFKPAPTQVYLFETKHEAKHPERLIELTPKFCRSVSGALNVEGAMKYYLASSLICSNASMMALFVGLLLKKL